MWVDIDDLRADLRALVREAEEGFEGRRNGKTLCYGMLVGYKKVEKMLDEMEEDYRKQGLEYIRSLREEGNEE